jgi:hypothetical protein
MERLAMRYAPPAKKPLLTSQDWLVLGIAAGATLMLCVALRWWAAREGALTVPADAEAVAEPAPGPTKTTETPPAATPPSAATDVPPPRTIPQSVAVSVTTESLRRHTRENPNAPDALSEDRIRAMERDGALVK